MKSPRPIKIRLPRCPIKINNARNKKRKWSEIHGHSTHKDIHPDFDNAIVIAASQTWSACLNQEGKNIASDEDETDPTRGKERESLTLTCCIQIDRAAEESTEDDVVRREEEDWSENLRQ